jgi:hypothetical protein
MKNFILLFVLSILCSACNSESIEPHMKYSAKFDNSKIGQVELILVGIAADRELRVFKKDREKMQYLSQGKDAFFTALYFKEDPVLIVTNVGVADILVMTTTDYGKMPKEELEHMADAVIGMASNKGIDLKVSN